MYPHILLDYVKLAICGYTDPTFYWY